MNIAQKAFEKLFPEKTMPEIQIKYSGRFSGYNANIRSRKKFFEEKIFISMSRKWKTVDEEIKMGLIQELLLKLYKKKKNTLNTDLYNKFIKNLHVSVPKTNIDPVLEESFDRVNKEYFYDFLEKTNLVWGKNSRRKLGSYTYSTDTISVSLIFKNKDTELLDYIMYHEMLHKKHKYEHRNGKSYHHTPEFKKKEKMFKNQKEIESKIKKLLRCRAFF